MRENFLGPLAAKFFVFGGLTILFAFLGMTYIFIFLKNTQSCFSEKPVKIMIFGGAIGC